VYLHYVFDLWVDRWRQQPGVGDVIVVRYADDVVMGFQHRHQAERFLGELRVRMSEHGLELHQEKTRLIEFGRFAESNRAKRGEGKPETFAFLGFTHICAKRRSDGKFTVLRKTLRQRLCQKAKAVHKELMLRRHEPVAQLGRWLRSVVQGFFNYFAVPGNMPALESFRTLVNRAWLRALRRRSQKGRKLTWEHMKPLIAKWIPSAKIIHLYPNQRLSLATRGRSRMR
jgi:RNA-directed DNA polymerase